MEKDIKSKWKQSFEMKKRTQYVYLHRALSGEVVYVGKGTRCRAYRAVGSGNRLQEHSEWLCDEYEKGRCPVEIVEFGLDKKTGKEKEAVLIDKYQPIFNVSGTERGRESMRKYKTDEWYPQIKELRDQGLSYKEISKKLPISRISGWRILQRGERNATTN